MDLRDWIDELCDALDIEVDVDTALVLDLARVAARQVQRPAAPLTAYLLGVAVGSSGAVDGDVEELAARAQLLAESWERPAGAPDPNDVDDEVPDDSGVDHTADRFEP